MNVWFAVLLAVGFLCACKDGGKSSVSDNTIAATDADVAYNPVYAKGYTVKLLDNGVRLVDVADPQKDKEKMPATYHFALVPKGEKVEVPDGYTPVQVPIERTIVMTMLQLSNFTALDALDAVKGITGTKNLFNKDVKARVKKGDIVKIGMEGNLAVQTWRI